MKNCGLYKMAIVIYWVLEYKQNYAKRNGLANERFSVSGEEISPKISLDKFDSVD